MIRLTGPSEAPLVAFDRRLAGLKDEYVKTRLAALRITLEGPYGAYASASPHGFSKWFAAVGMAQPEADLLRDFYNRTRGHWLGEALGRQSPCGYGRAFCQLCGLNEPSTSDHYLGKAKFPEFAVLPRNLVPTCAVCNSSRSTFGHDGARRIFHLFDDDVGAVPDMLIASVHVRDGYAEATYSLSSDSGPMADLYRRHFEALDLKRRYEVHAPPRLDAVSKEVRDRCRDVGSARQVLLDHAARESEARGRNNHETALLRGAADCQPFLEHAIVRST